MSELKKQSVLEDLVTGIKAHPAIDAKFRNMLVTCVKKHLDEMTIVSKKFKINTQFFAWFIKDMELDKRSDIKEEKSLYRNFLRLKKFQLIHSKSASFFPKSLTLLSINPNHFSLLAGGLAKLDTLIEAREVILEMLTQEESKKLAVYIYLRLFHVPPMTARTLKALQHEIIIPLPNDRVVLLLKEVLDFNVTDDTGMYRLQLLDMDISQRLISITEEEKGVIFKDQNYERLMQEFRDRYLKDMSIHLIKNLNKNFHLFHSSPLELTIKAKIVPTVPLTLTEIEKLFPHEQILSLEQQKAESFRIKSVFEKRETTRVHQKNKPKKKKEESASYGMMDIEALAELLRIKGTRFSKKEVEDAIDEIKQRLDGTQQLHEHLLFGYVLYILNFLLHRKLALSTVKNYLRLLNKHLFNAVEDLSDIKQHELTAISQRLEMMQYRESSIKAIYKNIRRFFRHHKKNYPELMDIASLYYPKSLVFKHELDAILEKIEINYKNKYKVKKIGETIKFHILQRKVLVLFGFYFGLRKSELRSRLMEDFYCYGDDFYIDVNREGLKKINRKLKTAQSQRRISAHITNESHREVINQWLALRENMRDAYKFLFLSKGASNNVLQSAIEEKIFDEITEAIREITRRYCTFHSLRHSFATYSVKEMLEHGVKMPYALLALAIQMGHQTPDVTLSSYLHAEVLELLLTHQFEIE